jgi:hypothetical protein
VGGHGQYAVPVAGIGSFNESLLHAALKVHAAPPGSRFEVEVGGYIVDALADDLVVEVQTRHLGAMRTKLAALLPEHRVRLVFPVAERRWIVRLHADGHIDRRRSPKHGRPLDLFGELVALPTLLAHPNFELEVVMTEDEELRRHEPGKAWRRRGWVVEGRRLVAVRDRYLFRRPDELLTLLPPDLPADFTSADVSTLGRMPRRVAQQAAYCLTALELIERIGKRGNVHIYRIKPTSPLAASSAAGASR